METMSRGADLQRYGCFEVDSMGFIQDIDANFCSTFQLRKKEYTGLPIDHLLKSRMSTENWKKADYTQKVMFAVINEEPVLIQISPQLNGFICQVVLRGKDTQEKDIYDFWKMMNPETKQKDKSFNPTDYSHRYSFDQIIGSSPAMKEVTILASKVAKSRSTVLITGESGTGKELFAQSIHDLSPRRQGPFVAVNCSAIPEQLFESELFGYEGGAFSGANRQGKAGKIELAQNGTLFLDEISELPLLLQGKLLRVLQEREVERIGATGRKFIDIRIIAATNKDLKILVNEGKFRQDLYYRLKVFEMKIPPLRQRTEDILPLTHYFIRNFNKQLDVNVQHIDGTLKQWLLNYSWPGNVRELQAAIERGMNITEGNTLFIEDIGFHSDLYNTSEEGNIEEFLPLEEEVAKAEISAINRALEKANGNRMIAANILKIHIASLYRKMAKYHMQKT